MREARTHAGPGLLEPPPPARHRVFPTRPPRAPTGAAAGQQAPASFEAEHERLRADHASARDVDRFLRELEK
jgi:hypothetical protein